MSILYLPTSLTVQGQEFAINADFRPCISIMQIFERTDLTDFEKIQCMVGILYEDEIPMDLMEDAAVQATSFLNCDESEEESGEGSTSKLKRLGRLFSWEQDLKYVIAAVDKVAGGSIRSRDFFHWWDFVSAFMETGECVFNTIVHQRKLKKTGKQTKADKEWWNDNREIAELKAEKKLTPAEQAALSEFTRLLEGGSVNGNNV